MTQDGGQLGEDLRGRCREAMGGGEKCEERKRELGDRECGER
jgi:hypothetical protein